MAISLPLEEMSLEEKIQAMESLWDDLRSRADGVDSPSWHGDTLAARETAIEQDKDRFEDWDNAKRNIKNQTL